MKIKELLLIFYLCIIVLAICGCVESSSTYLATPSPTVPPAVAQPTAISTPYPTVVATPDQIITPSPSPTSTPLPAPTKTPTPFPANSPSSNLEVHFINVGQGDSILIKIGDKCMLVDGGTPDAGSTVVSYLRGHGVNTIDVLLSTHPHNDHIGGLLDVLNSFAVRKVIDSGQVHTTNAFESYLDLIDQKNIPFVVGERGQSIDLSSEISIQILSPPSSKFGDDLNQNSIALQIMHGSVRFLLMGDAGADVESSLLSSGYNLDSDILKVGHHGSSSSSGIAFLSRVTPAVSVIMVGQNPYGHPTQTALNNLLNAGSKIYRTDNNGNIVVTSNGATYSISASGSPMIPAGSTATPSPGSIITPTPTLTPTLQPTSTPAPAPAPTGEQFVGSKNSNKFHKLSCRYVAQILDGNKIYFQTRDEAYAHSYVPCSVCDP